MREFFVLYVEIDAELSEQRQAIARSQHPVCRRMLARHVVRLKGDSVPAVTADYVAKNRITQVIFGRSAVKGWKKYLYYLALQRFMRGRPGCGCAYCDSDGENDR